MGSVLSVDDIEVGQVVALHSFVPTAGIKSDDGYAIPSSRGLVPLGIPLQVKAFSLPFIACELISPDGEEIGPAVVDVRRVRVCELDDAYVKAIVSNPNRREPEEIEDDVPL